MRTAVRSGLSVDEYLALERDGETKHEYVAGELFAMAGASKVHGRIVTNLVLATGNHLEAGPCDVYAADLKVHVEAAEAFYYADVVVVCDEPPRDGEYFTERPRLIVEVLSESTEAFDRGAKFASYRSLESLRDYVLVSATEPAVDVYHRREDGTWEIGRYLPGDAVPMRSIGLNVLVERLYTRTGLVP